MGAMPTGASRAVLVWTLVPTVVSAPRLRQRRPSAIESLTEPPLESSTMVAPPSSRPRANSSKSLGLSAVTMPTALTQPLQSGWHATQLNRIGNLRSSRVPPARAEPPSVTRTPGNTIQRAAAPSSAQPRKSSDLASLKLVPSPNPGQNSGNGPRSTPNDSLTPAFMKNNRASPYRP